MLLWLAAGKRVERPGWAGIDRLPVPDHLPTNSTRQSSRYAIIAARNERERERRSVIAAGDPHVVGERRWPSAGAVVAIMALTIVLPDDLRLGPPWLLPVFEGLLLATLIFADPGRIERQHPVLRILSIILVGMLVLESLWATALLIDALIVGTKVTNDASSLLLAGSIVWLSNILAFALLYWEVDGGGAAARAHEMPQYPDLAFQQQVNPDLAPPGWRPEFIDYLYLGFTNATAFSPTDVMPLASWAKVAMAVQSVISLLILGLVIARAVNVFT
jgi:hypothetical protein